MKINTTALTLILFSIVAVPFYLAADDGMEFTKSYYNNFFSGGKERIIVDGKTGSGQVEVNSSRVNIDLYEEYATVKVVYALEFNNRPGSVKFQYPMVRSTVDRKKTTSARRRPEIQSEEIAHTYTDFVISVDQKPLEYSFIESDIIEASIPYRIGNVTKTSDASNRKWREEVIDSFVYSYDFYEAEVPVTGDEVTITVSYKTYHYYNSIIMVNYPDSRVEDPALMYELIETGDGEERRSEKIFNFFLSTAYAAEANPVKTRRITLDAHIADTDFLEIFPSNYKKKGRRYYWKFKDEEPKPTHNIRIRFSPLYSPDTVSPSLLESVMEKTVVGDESFWLLKQVEDELIIGLKEKSSKSVMNIREVRVVPGYYLSKQQVKETEKPLRFEVSFSGSMDFTGSEKYIEKISRRDFRKLVKKRSYLKLYDGNAKTCKYVRIRILDSETENALPIYGVQLKE
jgi:hypothetical protein